jgi:F420H(2)-dependent quinone reductase
MPIADRAEAATTRTERLLRTINRVVMPALRAGIGAPLCGPGPFLVETTGRSSGLARAVPLFGHRVGGKVMVGTVRPTSQWMRNLEANPAANLWLNGTPRAATATVHRCPNGAAVAVIDLDDTQPTIDEAA